MITGAGKITAPAKAVAERIILFTRYPEPGRAKTRLIPLLGAKGAAALQQRMTEQTLDRIKLLAETRTLAAEIRYQGGDRARMKEWLGNDYPCLEQGTGDLGEKMARAFGAAFGAGAGRVLVVGSDCPGLSRAIMAAALERLKEVDLVIGPARDGGYYCIGMGRRLPELFIDMPWGTGAVLALTQARARKQGLTMHLLEPLQDMDRPEDLAELKNHPLARPLSDPGLSIIIPALNEEKLLPATLARIQNEKGLEIIVVDGHSSDRTREIAVAAGARVITSQPGRAGQMNTGAAAAQGEILLFLHSDTLLPAGFSEQVCRVAANPDTAAGAFRLLIDGPGPGFRLLERLINLRSGLLQFPYGDQALFLRRAVFEQEGGFPDLELMEDFELVRRLRRRGKIALLPIRAVTSARRWQRLGIVRTTLRNQLIIAGHLLGLSSGRLGRWYQKTDDR
ncbi:MAG: TIGR04283 family arsenosugar biosynthesis glycosyltransferase [Desulfobacterales bacterium]|nr:TIGR04283 family arsenosugar biosynthesis glycosyltransferase [Desulfobacterales bacterium]